MAMQQKEFAQRKPRRGGVVHFTNVIKTFESFSDGYAELLKYIPDIKVYGGEDLLHESVISSLLSVIGKNIYKYYYNQISLDYILNNSALDVSDVRIGD